MAQSHANAISTEASPNGMAQRHHLSKSLVDLEVLYSVIVTSLMNGFNKTRRQPRRLSGLEALPMFPSVQVPLFGDTFIKQT